MPANTRFDEAVVCEGAFYANSGLTKFRVGRGHKILIYGASGAIGSAAVQLAKAYGAEVTAVVATRQLELVKSLGANRAIDYTAEDFTRIGECFDFVLDAVGKVSFFRCRRLLKPKGTFIATDLGPWGQNLPLMIWSLITKNNRVLVPLPPRGSGHAFVEFLKLRMEAGQFHRSSIANIPSTRSPTPTAMWRRGKRSASSWSTSRRPKRASAQPNSIELV